MIVKPAKLTIVVIACGITKRKAIMKRTPLSNLVARTNPKPINPMLSDKTLNREMTTTKILSYRDP